MRNQTYEETQAVGQEYCIAPSSTRSKADPFPDASFSEKVALINLTPGHRRAVVLVLPPSVGQLSLQFIATELEISTPPKSPRAEC